MKQLYLCSVDKLTDKTKLIINTKTILIMPVLYGPFQSSLKDKNGKKLFYPRVLRTGNVSTSQISKEIATYSSLSDDWR